MKHARAIPFFAALFAAALSPAAVAEDVFRAGAHAIDVTPEKLPVVVLGMFTERTADRIHDRLFARCLVLESGAERVAIAIADSCMMPRDLLDEAKELAAKATGIPPERILIAATHTHSAPGTMGCLGSRPDAEYRRFLPGRIARGIELAWRNLAPARAGWTVAKAPAHTFCRRWIRRPDRMIEDPFGNRNVRANMHPGHQNPDAIGPSGPVDSDLSILSIQSAEGRPLAVLANFSMHYYDSPPVSSDYFGRFAAHLERLLGVEGATPPFVAIMSQGTSGDQMWMDYGSPRQEVGYDAYAGELARIAHQAWRTIEHRDRIPLAMRERRLPLRFRAPDAARLAWARKIAEGLSGRLPQTLPEVYALEAIHLHERPTAELKLQAIRLGDLGIAAIPNEVFGITGLKIKAQSPLRPTFTIELANGAEGYIPPPEQHRLGGYTTWPARTAGLEEEAEPRIAETVLGLLEEVSGRPRIGFAEVHGAYPRLILDQRPFAYWRLGEWSGPRAFDQSRAGRHGIYEDGVAFHLEGPVSAGFSGEAVNRAPHFAGGRMKAPAAGLGEAYSIELWFWNGLPADARPVAGYLLSRGVEGADGAPGDHLAIGGTAGHQGRLVFFNGNRLTGNIRNGALAGKTEIPLRTWRHLVFIRDRKKVSVHLDGRLEPEIAGEAEVAPRAGSETLFVGGRNDGFASFEGKIDEVSVYDRALTAEEVLLHHQAAGTAR